MEYNGWTTRVRVVEKRRWLLVVPLAFAFVLSYFHRFAMGVVAEDVMRDFALTHAAELGLLSSIYFYTYAALQLPAGISADTWGPRRTVTAALVVTAAGTLLFGWAPSLPWLYLGRFLAAAGVSMVYINIVKFYAAWFRSREFGTMSGLSSFIGNVGFALAAAPLALMVESAGWRASFYIIAIFTLLTAAACWLVVRDGPRAFGWPSIEEIEAAEGAEPAVGNGGEYSVRESLRFVIANRHNWPPFIAGMAAYSVFTSFAGIWGVPYLIQIHGLTRVEAANHMVAVSVGYMLAGPVAGYLSDRFRSRRWPFALNTVLFFAAWLVLTVWNGGKPPAAALYPLCFLLGIGGAGMTLTLACAKEVNPPNITGIAAGLVNAGPFLGAALVQPLFGVMLDLRWQGAIEQGVKVYPLEAFQLAFFMCAGLLAIATAAAFCVKETGCVNIAHKVIAYSKQPNEKF
jgi:sugar phosphate permease